MEEETAVRATGQQEIEEKTADKEYYTDEECMSGGDIPKGTGVDNSDIKSMTTNETEQNGNNRDGCRDESMGSTEEELLNIEEKAKDNKEEDNEEEYMENRMYTGRLEDFRADRSLPMRSLLTAMTVSLI